MTPHGPPIDSADARERREAGAVSLIRPLRPAPRRSRRGRDAAEVLAERRALVDAHPLGEQARAAAAEIVWPFSHEPAGLSRQIEIEDTAADLLADVAWVNHASQEAS
jgi:hypothetical protein